MYIKEHSGLKGGGAIYMKFKTHKDMYFLFILSVSNGLNGVCSNLSTNCSKTSHASLVQIFPNISSWEVICNAGSIPNIYLFRRQRQIFGYDYP